tara:strand:- start:611 stop:760 length:150 start_codon:yes stop_codon:yes gene_type:complete
VIHRERKGKKEDLKRYALRVVKLVYQHAQNRSLTQINKEENQGEKRRRK